MIPGLTSVIIPCHNHGALVTRAVESALAQGASTPVEVIVVENGSTDDSATVLAQLQQAHPDLRVIHLPEANLAAARNAGIEASTGEFLQFLDADDELLPLKIRRCLAAMSEEVGWVYCDVRYVHLDGSIELASQRYGYRQRETSGWLQPQLGVANFIPVHAPVIRRSVIGRIRFHDERRPEDWHFFYDVAGEGRARFITDVLAVYHKQPQSRNARRPRGMYVLPCVPPMRLNLGCGQRGKDSWHELRGLVNLDKSLGWTFEAGLADNPTPGQCLSFLASGSVAGITISHALMFVAFEEWPAIFAEFARVLAPGGVVRITEDDSLHPSSSRYGGWKGSEPAVVCLDASVVRRSLLEAGLHPVDVTLETTTYRDDSLRQAWHGEPPHVFVIEGVRASEVFLSPHHDDETLFGAFTLLKHRPMVVVAYASSGDYGTTEVRHLETHRACGLLGTGPVESWACETDDQLRAKLVDLETRIAPTRVWAPHPKASHRQHVALAQAAADIFGDRVVRYHTYLEGGVKVREDLPVPIDDERWVGRKLRALAEYRSQHEHPRAHVFFLDDLREYQAPAVTPTRAPMPAAPAPEPIAFSAHPRIIDTDALTVVTWHWGDLFPPVCVRNLRAMLARHLYVPHRFVVITDNGPALHDALATLGSVEGIEFAEAPTPLKGDIRCRRRLLGFNKDAHLGLGPRVLCLDLDTVITDDITPLVRRTEPIVAWRVNYAKVFSPACLLMDRGALHELYQLYADDPIGYPKKTRQERPSDLAMLNYWAKQTKTPIATWPDDAGIVPYFGEGYDQHDQFGITAKHPALPPGTRMVMLGGADLPVLLEGRYDWVKAHWRV